MRGGREEKRRVQQPLWSEAHVTSLCAWWLVVGQTVCGLQADSLCSVSVNSLSLPSAVFTVSDIQHGAHLVQYLNSSVPSNIIKYYRPLQPDIIKDSQIKLNDVFVPHIAIDRMFISEIRMCTSIWCVVWCSQCEFHFTSWMWCISGWNRMLKFISSKRK